MCHWESNVGRDGLSEPSGTEGDDVTFLTIWAEDVRALIVRCIVANPRAIGPFG